MITDYKTVDKWLLNILNSSVSILFRPICNDLPIKEGATGCCNKLIANYWEYNQQLLNQSMENKRKPGMMYTFPQWNPNMLNILKQAISSQIQSITLNNPSFCFKHQSLI